MASVQISGLLGHTDAHVDFIVTRLLIQHVWHIYSAFFSIPDPSIDHLTNYVISYSVVCFCPGHDGRQLLPAAAASGRWAFSRRRPPPAREGTHANSLAPNPVDVDIGAGGTSLAAWERNITHTSVYMFRKRLRSKNAKVFVSIHKIVTQVSVLVPLRLLRARAALRPLVQCPPAPRFSCMHALAQFMWFIMHFPW